MPFFGRLQVMSKHSVLFCGTPSFAVLSLRALHGSPLFEVKAVVTQPDRPVGRKQEMMAPAVKIAAEELGIPVLQPENINNAIADLGERPDFLVVVAYGKILKPEILAFPKIAPINLHGSLLPRWRGASPVEHAILHGDNATGVTVQIMAEELDAGDILSMAQTPINAHDTAMSLRERLARMGADLLVETLSMPLSPRPQPAEGITVCGKISREDGIVDPSLLTAEEIDRRLRAYFPWPGVQTDIEGRTVKILAASLTENPKAIPLHCNGDTTLYVTEVVEAGKKPMAAQDWLRGIQKT